MNKFKLSEEFKNRFEKYLSSDLFTNQANQAKSPYWEYHSKKISYSITNSTITLKGESGNYIPDKKNSFQFYSRLFKIFIKKTIFPERTNKISYKEAFTKVMNEDRVHKHQQVKLDKSKILARSISECKKIFPFNYELSDDMIRFYYLINILNSNIELSNTKIIAEIGAGNGNFISLLKHHFNPTSIINIDLPETLILSMVFLSNLFPKAKILLPNEVSGKINKDVLSKYDFIFLAPNQIKFLDENLIDLFINTDSFGEMNMSQITEYINFIQKAGKPNSFFFNCNRVEKIPFAVNNISNVEPIKFSNYPFFKNEIIFMEICRFISLSHAEPVYIRLEKIKK